MEKIFEKEKPDAVCHLAARAGVRFSVQHPEVSIRDNVHATAMILQLAAKYKVKNFVYASSSSVYGGCTTIPFREEDAEKQIALSPYAATKKTCNFSFFFSFFFFLVIHSFFFFVFHHFYFFSCSFFHSFILFCISTK